MKDGLRFTLVLAVVLIVGAPIGASGGVPIDPNLNDHVFGRVGGVRYASDSGAYDAGSGFANAVAGCGGPAWHMIGGGTASGGAPSASWLAADRGEDYTDPDTLLDDGWFSGGFGVAPASLTAFSICVRSVELSYPYTAVPNQPSSLRSGSVACGGAKWHVSTGSTFIATSNSWVSSSYPMDGGDPKITPDDGWAGTAYDTVGGAGGFYIYAVCATGVNLRYVKGVASPMAAGQVAKRKVFCAPTEHVVGGGARVSGAADRARLVTNAPFDGKDPGAIPDDGWRSIVYNVSGGTKSVTPYAICLG